MFSNMAQEGNFIDNSQIPFYIVLPAYITSELKTAFQIGFTFPTIFSNRYGHSFNPDVFRYDDAVTNVDCLTI